MRRWLPGICLALFGFVFAIAAARAQQLIPTWTAQADKDWWTAHPTPASWTGASNALQSQLEAIYKQDGLSCFTNSDFRSWMEHLEWVRLGLDSPDDIATPQDLQTFIALGEDETVSHLIVEKMVPRNVKAKALRNLLDLAEANMGDLHEYAALGVAFSLVFDEPFPGDWPHSQVSQNAVPIGDLNIVKRFQFYVQANRDKKLELDPTQLRVEDLKYLVDSEVQLSELTYAQANPNHIPYEHFDQAFFSIRYDTARVANGNDVFKWNRPTYTLKDIEDHGGICVDQAYYASLLGKGLGIPTIYFVGEGTSGGHAWFGYLTHSGKWDLDCGRYASQNYPRGYALDPQTWQEVNDTTLQRLAKNGDADPNFQPASTALAWARMHATAANYPQILEDARTLMPELAAPWQAEGDYIDSNAKATVEDKKTFYQSWIDQFTSDAEMKVEAQKRLLAALKAANDPDADSLQRDIVMQNRSTGFDLGVQGSVGGIEDKFKAQDWDGAKVAFETSVRDFKDQGGGTFLQSVIQPYVMMCLQYGRPDQARDGLHFTEERMPMESGSILREEFEKLKMKVDWAEAAFPEMERWLGVVDSGDYFRAWQGSAAPMALLEGADDFIKRMTEQRKPFGPCSSRVMSEPPQMSDGVSMRDGKDLKGEFVVGVYTGSFGTISEGKETVIFMKESGEWKPLSYRIER